MSTEQDQLLTMLDMTAGAFEVFRLLDDWDSAANAFYTALDAVWQQYAMQDETAPLVCPVTPKLQWAEDYLMESSL